jgi:hypothetical protein
VPVPKLKLARRRSALGPKIGGSGERIKPVPPREKPK